jgi:hypothetical protein
MGQTPVLGALGERQCESSDLEQGCPLNFDWSPRW